MVLLGQSAKDMLRSQLASGNPFKVIKEFQEVRAPLCAAVGLGTHGVSCRTRRRVITCTDHAVATQVQLLALATAHGGGGGWGGLPPGAGSLLDRPSSVDSWRQQVHQHCAASSNFCGATWL